MPTDVSQDKREQFLLLRIRAFKDKAAFASLINMHGEHVLKFLARKLPRIEDAEDAYSTVLLRLWEYMTSAEVKHFSGLAFTLARHAIAEFYKQRELKPTVALETEEGHERPLEAQGSHAQIERSTEMRLLLESMRELSEDERDAIIMRHIDGYSIQDIALHIDKKVNATSVLIHRAMKKLKDKYDRP